VRAAVKREALAAARDQSLRENACLMEELSVVVSLALDGIRKSLAGGWARDRERPDQPAPRPLERTDHGELVEALHQATQRRRATSRS
jgi:hypothetical protein